MTELKNRNDLKFYAWLIEGERLKMLSQSGKEKLKLYRMYHPDMDESKLRKDYYQQYRNY